ncbi:response regulator transcription factor [Methylotenera sp. G11]|uniref:response regulator transcription factor n=1 Tax=Methylotenera sp. G11 TaxID=1506585 RepID=UPI000B2B9927|nr:response regulator transcription factor [Methylotenera sp. G11]
MNFLVSKNPVLIDQYWNILLEQGSSLLLSDFTDLVWRAKTSDKGLVLVDTQVDGFAGMHSLTELKRINQSLKVLIIAIDLTTEDELSALAAGASGSCRSNLLPDKVRQIFTTVQDGGVWISSTGLPQLLQRFKRLEEMSSKNAPKNESAQQHEKISSLTPREREIVELVASGDCNKIIASKLNIADRTVKAHLSVIFQKLKVNDRLQLALLANKSLDNKNRAGL